MNSDIVRQSLTWPGREFYSLGSDILKDDEYKEEQREGSGFEVVKGEQNEMLDK